MDKIIFPQSKLDLPCDGKEVAFFASLKEAEAYCEENDGRFAIMPARKVRHDAPAKWPVLQLTE